MPHVPTKTGMRAGSIPVIHHRCIEEQFQPPFWNQQTLMRLSPLFFVVSWLEYNRLPVCANMPQGCVTKGNRCFKPSQHFQEPAGDKSSRVKWRGWIPFWIFSPPWPLMPAWAGRRSGLPLACRKRPNLLSNRPSALLWCAQIYHGNKTQWQRVSQFIAGSIIRATLRFVGNSLPLTGRHSWLEIDQVI